MTTKSAFDLSGKVALVTGAGRGIGAAIARSLANAGAHVVVNDRDAERARLVVKQITEDGGEALLVHADISLKPSVELLFDKALRWHNHLDILICNAGITSSANIFDITLSE
jgi:NAD(P)-dependent dehydrogenase (short-subunit alcohol dehydrogenase family)